MCRRGSQLVDGAPVVSAAYHALFHNLMAPYMKEETFGTTGAHVDRWFDTISKGGGPNRPRIGGSEKGQSA